MKKRVLAIVLLIMMMMTIAGCHYRPYFYLNKKATASEKMLEIAEERGYLVTDITHEKEYSLAVYKIVVRDGLQFVYYEQEDESDAIASWETNRSMLRENLEGYEEKHSGGKNYLKYTITTESQFCTVRQVENTFIYMVTAIENADEARQLLMGLGY